MRFPRQVTARASGLLAGTKLPLPAGATARALTPTHDASYWSARTSGMDFTAEDRVEPAAYNRVLWEGLMPGKTYPSTRTAK